MPSVRERRVPFRSVPAAVVLLVLASLSVGCRPGIAKVNGQPDQFYDQELSFSGRIDDVVVRTERGKAQVFHLVSKDGHRVIVAMDEGTSHRPGDQVRVHGTFVRKHVLDDKSFYDTLVATSIRTAGRWPYLPFL